MKQSESKPKTVSIFTKDGKTLVELSSMQYKDGRLELKGKTFGTMPATMFVMPIDVWNLLSLVPFSVIRKMPAMLLAGRKESKKVPRQPD